MSSAAFSFVAHSACIDVQLDPTGRSRITFSNSDPLTIRTEHPFVRGLAADPCAFNVFMVIKPSKTAIGFSFGQNPAECSKYMTPAHRSGDQYASFGGAGFIYPGQLRAAQGYSEGDSVRVACDFGANVITFCVNGDDVAAVPLPADVLLVYPAISCERGETVMETWFQ
jgi:hypothetical protein